MLETRRPWRRLFYCLISLLLMAAVGRTQAGPAKTLISDTMYRADGVPASGVLVISWPSFITANQKAVAAGAMSYTIPAGGAISLELAPNTGATPEGTLYKVLIKQDDGASSTEYWEVPAGGPVTLSQIRTNLAPVAPVQGVTKQYVDGLMAQAVRRAGDTMTGPLALSADPIDPVQAATKRYVDTTVNDVLVQWEPPGDATLVHKTGDETIAGEKTFTGGISAIAYRNRSDVVDVVADCGAAGDGVTDDSAAINACFANHKGKTIFFPKRAAFGSSTADYYAASNIVQLGHGTIARGSGMNASNTTFSGTTIKFAPGAGWKIGTQNAGSSPQNDCQACTLEDLNFVGPKIYTGNSAAECVIPATDGRGLAYGNGLAASGDLTDGVTINSNFVTVRNVWSGGFARYGLRCNGNSTGGAGGGWCDNAAIENTIAYGNRGSGYFVSGADSNGGHLTQTRAYSNQLWGHELYSFLGTTTLAREDHSNHAQFTSAGPPVNVASISGDGTQTVFMTTAQAIPEVGDGNIVVVAGTTNWNGSYAVIGKDPETNDYALKTLGLPIKSIAHVDNQNIGGTLYGVVTIETYTDHHYTAGNQAAISGVSGQTYGIPYNGSNDCGGAVPRPSGCKAVIYDIPDSTHFRYLQSPGADQQFPAGASPVGHVASVQNPVTPAEATGTVRLASCDEAWLAAGVDGGSTKNNAGAVTSVHVGAYSEADNGTGATTGGASKMGPTNSLVIGPASSTGYDVAGGNYPAGLLTTDTSGAVFVGKLGFKNFTASGYGDNRTTWGAGLTATEQNNSFGMLSTTGSGLLMRHASELRKITEGATNNVWFGYRTYLNYDYSGFFNYSHLWGIADNATSCGVGETQPDCSKPKFWMPNGFYLGYEGGSTKRNRFSQVNNAAPTTGTWRKGDVVFNLNPTAGGTFAWIATTDGTPGTWAAVPLTDASGSLNADTVDGKHAADFPLKPVGDCHDPSTSKVIYDQSTNALACGTDTAGGGGGLAMMPFVCSGTLGTTSGNWYATTLGGAANTNCNVGVVGNVFEIPVAFDGTFSKLCARTATACTTGADVTLYVDGAATTLTVNVGTGTTAVCDNTHTVAATQGQTFSVRVSPKQATETCASVRGTVVYN
ncbi:MAG: hypothetical protein ACE14L_17470 [Terriglobales bacterium]